MTILDLKEVNSHLSKATYQEGQEDVRIKAHQIPFCSQKPKVAWRYLRVMLPLGMTRVKMTCAPTTIHMWKL